MAIKRRNFDIFRDIIQENVDIVLVSTLKVFGKVAYERFTYVNRYQVRSLATNGNIDYKIIKFSAYYVTIQLTLDQSD